MEAERSLEQMDRGLWYKVDLAKIRDQENIASTFVQLSEDEATSAFIKHSFEQSDWLFTQLYYNFAKSLLSWFYCQTDINGILARGSMFVFSKEQFLLLSSSISPPSFTPSSTLPALLDLGSGDGRPTTSLSPFFDQTFVTEVSRPMQKLCTARGFKAHHIPLSIFRSNFCHRSLTPHAETMHSPRFQGPPHPSLHFSIKLLSPKSHAPCRNYAQPEVSRPTTSLSPFFDQTFVTEVSRPMQKL